jgi:hypothetical protein
MLGEEIQTFGSTAVAEARCGLAVGTNPRPFRDY